MGAGWNRPLVWGALEMLMGDAAKSDDDRDIAAGASKRYKDLVADGQSLIDRKKTGNGQGAERIPEGVCPGMA